MKMARYLVNAYLAARFSDERAEVGVHKVSTAVTGMPFLDSVVPSDAAAWFSMAAERQLFSSAAHAGKAAPRVIRKPLLISTRTSTIPWVRMS